MFGIDSSELAIIALVALLVIGPKDLPRVMRMVGQWVSKGRSMTRHVRSGFDAMMREAEMEEMQKVWAAQNEAIMKATALPDLSIDLAAESQASDTWTTPEPPLAPDGPADAASQSSPKSVGEATAVAKPKRKRAAKPKPASTAADAPSEP